MCYNSLKTEAGPSALPSSLPYVISFMPELKCEPRRRSKTTLSCYFALIFSFCFTAGCLAATADELQQERETLQTYEQRIPSLLTAMRSLDRQLAALQRQGDGVERDLDELTRTYLTRQREHEQALAAAAARNDKNADAAAEHSRFQYYLVERKLTRLQKKAEQLDQDMAPLKQSLRDRQRQLQQSEKKIAAQKKVITRLASAPPTIPERIEIKSRNKTAAPSQQASSPASVPPNATLAAPPKRAVRNTVKTTNSKPTATKAEQRYAITQARRLQALLATAASEKPAGERAKTLEVQHKDKSGAKHFYDLAYIGANHYTTEGTVHAGKHVFKIAKQRWITNIPAHDDGASYVFVLNATPHRRLELIMYNAALAPPKPPQANKTSLSKK